MGGRIKFLFSRFFKDIEQRGWSALHMPVMLNLSRHVSGPRVHMYLPAHDQCWLRMKTEMDVMRDIYNPISNPDRIGWFLGNIWLNFPLHSDNQYLHFILKLAPLASSWDTAYFKNNLNLFCSFHHKQTPQSNLVKSLLANSIRRFHCPAGSMTRTWITVPGRTQPRDPSIFPSGRGPGKCYWLIRWSAGFYSQIHPVSKSPLLHKKSNPFMMRKINPMTKKSNGEKFRTQR